VNGAPPDLPARCRVAQMIGGALVAAVVVYAILVEVIRARRGGFAGFATAAPIDTLRTVFIVLAIADLALIRFIRARILAPPARGGTAAGNTAPPLTQRLLNASVVSLSMCLAIAVYGLVLFLLGGRPVDFYSFAIVALLGLAVFFPRQSQWEEWARSDGHPRVKAHDLKLVTLAESPDLLPAVRRLTRAVWPPHMEYIHHDAVCDRHWPMLLREFAHLQPILCDRRGRVQAAGYTIPFVWDGGTRSLPSGVDGVLVRGVAGHARGRRPNTLSALLAAVDPAQQGRGLSRRVIEAMATLAARHGLGALVAPVRPTLKHR